MSDSITLEEAAQVMCVLMEQEPTPMNVKKAYKRLQECLKTILRSPGETPVQEGISMKVVILICDSHNQYTDYMKRQIGETTPWVDLKLSIGRYTIGNTLYIPLCHQEDIRKLMGLNRRNIEIRIIGESAMIAYLTLKQAPKAFGVTN